MSLVRSSRPNWLRPDGALFVISSILLITEFSSSVSAVKSSTYDVDANWISLDENFPPTNNAHDPNKIDRLFYARGELKAQMNLTSSILEEMEKHPATSYHVRFQIWRNAVRCPKYISVGSDSITNIVDSKWFLVDKHYTYEEFKTFSVWLTADPACVKSLMAIKDLTLTYNSYIVSESTPETHQIALNYLPDGIADADLSKWAYFFHDCNTVDAQCTIVVPSATIKTKEVKISFWHTQTGNVEITVKENANLKHTVAPKNVEAFAIAHNDKSDKDLTIHIMAKDASPIVVRFEDQASEKLVGHNLLHLEQAAQHFLEAHKEARLLPDFSQSSSVLLLNDAHEVNIKSCYDFSYLLDYQNGPTETTPRYTISIEIAGTSSYELFDFIPQIGSTQTIAFCLRDFIFDPTVFGAKIQLLLHADSVRVLDKSNKPKLALVSVVKHADSAADVVNEVIKYIKGDEPKKWSLIVPKISTDILSTTENKPITIKTTNYKQSRQIQSVWLENEINISKKPVKVQIVLRQTDSVLLAKLANEIKLHASICDDIMECILTADLKKVEADNSKINYEFIFEAHPNAHRKHIKLVLALELPTVAPDSELDISLINFGDPCYVNEECPNVAGSKKHCVADPKTTLANDFKAACRCNEGLGGETCELELQCLKIEDAKTKCKFDPTNILDMNSKCRNTLDNKNYECICPTDPMRVQESDATACILKGIALPIKKQDTTKTTWTFDLTYIRKDSYDVCFKFQPLFDVVEDVYQSGSISVNLQSKDSSLKLIQEQTFVRYDSQSDPIIDMCLGNFIDLDKFKTEGAQLILEIMTTDAFGWKDNDFSVSGKTRVTPSASVKVDKFQISPISQNNVLRVNDKEIVFQIPVPDNSKFPISKISLFSDWIYIDKSIKDVDKINLNTIKFTPSSTDLKITVQICRPRIGGIDCETLTETEKLADILTDVIKEGKFQVVLTAQTDKELEKVAVAALKIVPEVSIWDACNLHKDVASGGCHSGTCTAGNDASTFGCGTCAAGFGGKLCQYKNDEICDVNNKKTCTDQGSECLVGEDGRFACKCLIGYVFNNGTHKCDRMTIKSESTTCSDGPNGCFISLSDHFQYLPKNFPRIEKVTTKSLYYTIQSNSKVTIKVEDPDKLMSKAENDVCVRFRYFIAPEAKLTLRFNDQIDLLAIDGIASIDTNDQTQNSEHQVVSLGLTDETRVCIKALLPLKKLHNAAAFELSFLSQNPTKNDAVVVEIISFDSQNVLELKQVHLPEKALRYLSQKTDELVNASDVDKQAGIHFQWTFTFPSTRWGMNGLQINKLNSGTGSGTQEWAFLESAWIDRPIRASNSKVYLNFKLDVPIDIQESDLHTDIYLIDTDRRQLNKVNSLSGKAPPTAPPTTLAPTATPTGTPAPTAEPPTPAPAPTTVQPPTIKTFEYVFPLNNINVKQYKIQFHIRYQDKKSDVPKTTPLLRIYDISFGDPCISIDSTVTTGRARVCYGVDNNYNIVEDKNVQCMRNTSLPNDKVDYQCKCAENSGLIGKDCKQANYCAFKHPFTVVADKGDAPRNEKYTQTGDEFCSQGKQISKCINSRYGDSKFLCNCAKTTEYFDLITKQCKPIDACLLYPCNFETEECVGNDKEALKRKCNCRKGFVHKDVDDGHGKSVIFCVQSQECNKKEKCGSEDPNLHCLVGTNGQHTCKCDRGFNRDANNNCISNLCSFPALHKCPQDCSPDSNAPYYKCRCNEEYYQLATTTNDSTKTTTYECKVKSGVTFPSTCTCTGKYKFCKAGKCDCIDNFELNSNGECGPKATHKLPACPNNRYKLDTINQINEVVCDCANSTRGHFVDEQGYKGTCSLSKTMCDIGEAGRNLCNLREAGCVVNALNVEDYFCECHVGKMFPDITRMKSGELLRGKHKTTCMDVCDLPYKKSECSAIGAKCNPMKLWTMIAGFSDFSKIPAREYCDCVPGTFYNVDLSACVQELEALGLNITFRWTHDLQLNYEEMKLDLIELHPSTMPTSVTEPSGFNGKFIDPIGLGHAELRSYALNRKEEETIEQQWGLLIKQSLLLGEVEKLFYNFKIIDHLMHDSKQLVKHDLQIVSLDEVNIDERQNYLLRLAVKVPEHIQLSASEEMSFDAEEPMAQDTASAVILPYELAVSYEHLEKSCHPIPESKNCIIPYMQLVLAPGGIKPDLHLPCQNPANACLGMSNCVPLNGSQFACECSPEYFDVESKYTFKSNDPLVVFRNDRCKAKKLCPSKCPTELTNNECIEKDPAPISVNDTFVWTKEVSCGCKTGFGWDSAATGTQRQCTAVCSIAACTSNGKCQGSDHSATCECDSGYYGLRCEHATASVTWWIVAVVLLAVLALVGIGAALFFWRKR